jgi:tetratricopeptide (TPR) repeat protein
MNGYRIPNNQGNDFYKEKQYGQALDKYLEALYGLNFQDQTIEMDKKVNFDLKVPLLNNMAICLLQVNEYKKVISMTDQVLIIDPENFKALARRTSGFLELGNLTDAKSALDKAKKVARANEDRKITVDLQKQYDKKATIEQKFAKQVFEKTIESKYLSYQII